MRALAIALVLLAALPLPARGSGRAPARPEMVTVPAGSYLPLYAPGRARVRVAAFRLDRHPVTRGEYLAWVRADPRWRRGAARPVFVGSRYLAGWRAPLDAGAPADLRRPATEVSWFAARAYCRAQGKRLPTADEWEYAAAASETARDASGSAEFTGRLLGLYSARTATPGAVGSTFRNAYGVWDMHGLVWEWVDDFNNQLVSDDSRSAGERDHKLYCAAGAVGATDPSNYPAFLRLAFRAGLTGRSTAGSLGFRCASSL